MQQETGGYIRVTLFQIKDHNKTTPEAVRWQVI
jgi:hypothetical protein